MTEALIGDYTVVWLTAGLYVGLNGEGVPVLYYFDTRSAFSALTGDSSLFLNRVHRNNGKPARRDDLGMRVV